MRAVKLLCVLIGLSLWVASCAAAAEEGVSLAYKFTEGGKLAYDVTFSGAGKLTSPDAQTSPLVIQGSASVSQTVAKVEADGSAVLETVLPRADITAAVGDKKARFTWADGAMRWYLDGQERTPPSADLSKAPGLSSPIRVTMKPDGSVTDISFSDAQIMDMLRKLAPGMASSMPTPSTMPTFPADPVKVGESWTKTGDLPLGEGQTLTYNTRRTLESLTSKGGVDLAKISGYGEVKYRGSTQAITGPDGKQLTFSIAEMKETVTSTEFFNVGAGRMVRGDYELVVSVKVSAGVGGANQSGSAELRLRATVVGR